MPGGDLVVRLDAENETAYLAGSAIVVYEGALDEEILR